MIPAGICQCGCGKPTPTAKKTDSRNGAIAGQPLRLLHGHKAPKQRGRRTRAKGLAEYAEQLFHVSQELIAAVHDDGPDQLRAHYHRAMRLRPPNGVDPALALATVIAAQVDPDAPTSRRIGWVLALADDTPQERSA